MRAYASQRAHFVSLVRGVERFATAVADIDDRLVWSISVGRHALVTRDFYLLEIARFRERFEHR
jgi:hypothetical protein